MATGSGSWCPQLTRFAHNPHGLHALASGFKNFVTDHAQGLSQLSGALKIVSGIAGVLSFIPVAGEVALAVALVTAGTALLIDASLKHATGKGSWTSIAIDGALLALPFGIGKGITALRAARGAEKLADAAASGLPGLVVNDAQFGAKVGRHAKDFGLNPADPAARDFVRSRINDIHANPTEVRQGPWNPKGGGGSDYLFYRQDADVVVTRGDGDFVTILKDGESNGWFQGAEEVGR